MTVQFAYPVVVSALMSLATSTLGPDVRVTRGRDISDDPGDVFMVGVSSLDDAGGWDSAGTFDQDYQTFGTSRVETGSVNLLALSSNGDADVDAACTAAFAQVNALAAAIRADQTLGISSFDYLMTKFQTGEVHESSNDGGAMATLSCTVHYQARI